MVYGTPGKMGSKEEGNGSRFWSEQSQGSETAISGLALPWV